MMCETARPRIRVEVKVWIHHHHHKTPQVRIRLIRECERRHGRGEGVRRAHQLMNLDVVMKLTFVGHPPHLEI